MLSPDGKWLAFVASQNGNRQLFIAPVAQLDKERALTSGPKEFRGGGLRWTPGGTHLIYSSDRDGDEDSRLYSMEVKTGAVRELTPVPAANAFVQDISERFPDEILVAISDRDPAARDYYRVNYLTGKAIPVFVNQRGFRAVTFDENWAPRVALRYSESGQQIWSVEADNTWTRILERPFDGSSIIPLFVRGNKAWVGGALDGDKAGVYQVDLVTNELKLVFADEKFDVSLESSSPEFDPTTGEVLAVHVEKDRGHWMGIDPNWKASLDFLASRTTGDVNLGNRSQNDRRWIVAFSFDKQPTSFSVYDRTSNTLTPLWNQSEALAGFPLARVYPVVIRARDGLEMLCYLTLPPSHDREGIARPDRPLPMVLNVHGGPTARDGWGFSPECQFLANRGYAVLQVNFRGSSGFGRRHEGLGHRQWGRAMHTDLLDGVAWAIEQKIADPGKVCVYGGSYGGYASLWAITQSPEVFCCCVSIVGPSNLNTFIENIPRDWPEDYWAATLGDWRTLQGREELSRFSPITYASTVRKPVLIVQGENDPRVVKSESDQMAFALQDAGVRVTYALYPDEGHGIGKSENTPGFWALIENFLAQPECLGGRCEPIGQDIEGSSLLVPIGKERVPGLAEALERYAPGLNEKE